MFLQDRRSRRVLGSAAIEALAAGSRQRRNASRNSPRRDGVKRAGCTEP